jgi:hypothetical protein
MSNLKFLLALFMVLFIVDLLFMYYAFIIFTELLKQI